MTCIVGITNGKTVWMGGDSLGADTSFMRVVRDDKKVFISGEYIMGFTTSFRMGDILKWSFVPPKIPKKEKNLEKFMATTFIDGIIALFDKHGFARVNANRKEGGEFLVGIRGKLFHIQSDYQVGIPSRGYSACGCGNDLALGSLYTSDPCTIGLATGFEARITLALEAAAMGSAGVSPPWIILKK
jgi:hypothetical protein